VVFTFKKKKEIFGLEETAPRSTLRWRPGRAWALGLGAVFAICLSALVRNSASEFLYFNF
jgi:hypothetical protein